MKSEYTIPPSYLQSPVILFRKGGREYEQEEKDCSDKFVTVRLRSSVPANSLVIGRYSVLPFYKELVEDLSTTGSRLINDYRQHRYLADMRNWYEDLKEHTPRTWFSMAEVPDNIGPLIVKGETNSRKDLWATHMFANNKKEAIEVMIKLQKDTLFANQSIYVREFVNFANYGLDEISGGRPITDEYRVFVLDGKPIVKGFYWTSQVDQIKSPPQPSTISEEFLKTVINKISESNAAPRFYVIDVAKLQNGDWMVVELNDGQMSGLSECSSVELYSKLKFELWEKHWQPQS